MGMMHYAFIIFLAFVLEPRPALAQTTVCPPRCIDGSWTMDSTGDYCYQVFTTKLTGSAAQAACQTYTNGASTGNLASIESSTENTFVMGLLTQSAHIGLVTFCNPSSSTSCWEWEDGTTYSYTNWGSGQPKKKKPCGFMKTDGTWSSSKCSKKYHYVCETATEDRCATTTTTTTTTSTTT